MSGEAGELFSESGTDSVFDFPFPGNYCAAKDGGGDVYAAGKTLKKFPFLPHGTWVWKIVFRNRPRDEKTAF